MGALFLQVGRRRPGARAIVAELMLQWQEQLAAGMRALRSEGLVSPALDVDRAAAALLAGIQGGVSILMSTGDSAHLRAAIDTGIEHLRTATDRSRPAWRNGRYGAQAAVPTTASPTRSWRGTTRRARLGTSRGCATPHVAALQIASL